jgi:ABC-type antimicrobial peptide transport system permease subunit
MQVMVRAHAGPEIAGRLRAAVAQVDPDVPISGMKTQADQIDETISRERVFSVLLTLFGAFALLLACIGLHGVTAYAVARRTSEIGIRMALGAQRGSVLWLVLRQVVVLTLCGLVAGVPAAIAAARSVSSLLFGVAPGDPASVAAAALILCGVALISGLLPALRASRMDPLRALKVE